MLDAEALDQPLLRLEEPGEVTRAAQGLDVFDARAGHHLGPHRQRLRSAQRAIGVERAQHRRLEQGALGLVDEARPRSPGGGQLLGAPGDEQGQRPGGRQQIDLPRVEIAAHLEQLGAGVARAPGEDLDGLLRRQRHHPAGPAPAHQPQHEVDQRERTRRGVEELALGVDLPQLLVEREVGLAAAAGWCPGSAARRTSRS